MRVFRSSGKGRLKNRDGGSRGRWGRLGRRRMRMRRAGEPVDKVIGWPGAGELELALAHHGASGGELVLVALNVFAIDEVGDVEDHLSALCEPAAYFFIKRHK